MGPMRTAVVSDLHLGGLADADVAREGEPLDALVDAVSDADRLVLLGDIVELRERPLAEALEVAGRCWRRLGARDGRPPGRDRAGQPRPRACGAVARPAAARGRAGCRRRRSGRSSRATAPPGASPSGCPTCELTLAYPGLRLRDDVYATHGHYLDLHLTIPRLESIAASAMGRLTKLGHDAHSAADYETILAPLYAFYAGLAQGASAAALAGGSSFSRTVWQWASDGRGAEHPRPRARRHA